MARFCAWLSGIEGTLEDTEQMPESARHIVTYLDLSYEERWMAVQVTFSQINKNGMHTYKETTFSW
jgi:hypothetical protein